MKAQEPNPLQLRAHRAMVRKFCSFISKMLRHSTERPTAIFPLSRYPGPLGGLIWRKRENALTGPVRCASGGVEATEASPGIMSSCPDRSRGRGRFLGTSCWSAPLDSLVSSCSPNAMYNAAVPTQPLSSLVRKN